MFASIVAAIANLILNSIFIPKYGFVAAGYTTLVSYIIQVFIDFFAMKKVMGFSLYDTKFLMGISTAVIVISLVSSITYNYPLIRYVVFVALLATTYFNKNKIIQVFKTIKNK